VFVPDREGYGRYKEGVYGDWTSRPYAEFLPSLTNHKTLSQQQIMARTRPTTQKLLAVSLIVTSCIFLSIHFRMGSLLDDARRLYEESNCGTGGHNNRRRRLQSTVPAAARKAKLADGCHHVFLDVGANIGIHARFLFESELYPDAAALKWFDDAYGTSRDNRDICVFAFEPNPKHTQRLHDLSEAYAAMGWRYIPIMAGVSDYEGTLEFVPSRDDLGRGFTARGSGQGNDKNKHMISVPVKRLASWLLDEIDGRLPPKKVYGSYQTSVPKVVMKLDIETLEYIVLPDLMLSGALCTVVDAVYGEVHYQFFPLDFKENGLHFDKAVDAKKYFLDQLQMLKVSRNCRATWSIDDDESYSYDGQPLPNQKPAGSKSRVGNKTAAVDKTPKLQVADTKKRIAKK
jgi:Methyltransferase FkbM domain